MDQTYEGWKNPYRDAYIWLKGEILDIKGISDALTGRDTVVKQQSSLMSKKRSDQAELDKLNQGKKSLKNFFKTKSGKENDIISLQAAIEVAAKDLEDYNSLINFLTIYHGQIAIPKFKKEKANQYYKMLHYFSVKEISNSHLSATLWHSLLEVCTNVWDDQDTWVWLLAYQILIIILLN